VRKPVPTNEQLPPKLMASPAFVLIQLGMMAQEWTAEALLPVGLDLRQFAAMLLISDRGLPQVMIAERLGVSAAAVSGLVSRLVDEELAVRRVDYGDARRRVVVLTEAGRQLLAVAADEVSAVEAALTEHLSEETVARIATMAPPRPSPIQRIFRELAPRAPVRDWNDWGRVPRW
jgi:DNA-binding MarR family transcriptional regulator